MNAARSLITASVLLALGISTGAGAAPQKNEDSAYQWGRWAVLSPAAGGTETYVKVAMPGAVANARPGDANEFTPEIESVDEPGPTPPAIDGFCQAGAQCGYATYTRQPGNDTQTAAVPEGFDLSGQDPNGPVLARIDITSTPVTSNNASDLQPAIAGSGNGPQTAQFTISDTGNSAFPDIQSVQMDNGSGGDQFAGQQVVSVSDSAPLNDNGTFVRTTDSQLSATDTSGQSYGGVDAGTWSNAQQRVLQLISGDSNNTNPSSMTGQQVTGGYFVFGQTATVEQMQAFAAGNASAIYQGKVLDYNSGVTLTFDFGANTFQGSYAAENGFNGLEINGVVQGVNFAAQDGNRSVTGSFFNAGGNASGAVNNGSQLGVFSADHVTSP